MDSIITKQHIVYCQSKISRRLRFIHFLFVVKLFLYEMPFVHTLGWSSTPKYTQLSHISKTYFRYVSGCYDTILLYTKSPQF